MGLTSAQSCAARNNLVSCSSSPEVAAEGYEPIVEVMIPLTVTREELALARSWVESVLVEHT
ncbi:MAG: hypothetical protein ACKODN_11945, partial [Actinomycetota bacterium]